MTPAAVTPAARTPRPTGARGERPGGARADGAPARGHRTAPARRSPVPRPPRRVSGPVAPARTPRAAATQPALPRAAPPRPAAPRARLPVRALSTLRTLPDHSLLDRVVRGRLWIPLLGVLLVGIVAMQVEVLKLNASIGHAMVRTGQLQSENQLLRTSVSALSDDQRIETDAAEMGMSMPAPSTPQFLGDRGAGDLARALANIHPPDPAGFAERTSAAAAARAASVIPTSGQ
jgi:cell division protein FtsL